MQVTISGVAHIIVEIRFEKTIEVSKEQVVKELEMEDYQEEWEDNIEDYVRCVHTEPFQNEIESGTVLELTDDTDGYSLGFEGFTFDRFEEFNVEQ